MIGARSAAAEVVKKWWPHAATIVQDFDATLRVASIKAALREQRLWNLYERLEALVPDIRDQYTSFALDTEYLRVNVRALHAFQVALALRALEIVDTSESTTVVDIGDSAGTHLDYLRRLRPDLHLRCLGINVDEAAVERIRSRGLEAVRSRAESLSLNGVAADLLLLFETIEHLSDPASFLQRLAQANGRALVLTTPYVRQSRVGLHHLREGRRPIVTPENTHIFELSPGDWTLLARHAGWRVVDERIYRQFPQRGILRAMRRRWRRLDFEGFWGAILVPDSEYSRLYTGWTSPGEAGSSRG